MDTSGLARCSVSGYSRSPRPPAITNANTRDANWRLDGMDTVSRSLIDCFDSVPAEGRAVNAKIFDPENTDNRVGTLACQEKERLQFRANPDDDSPADRRATLFRCRF